MRHDCVHVHESTRACMYMRHVHVSLDRAITTLQPLVHIGIITTAIAVHTLQFTISTDVIL